MRISGSNRVLAVHDLDRSGAWHRDLFDCELDDPDPGNWRFCRTGGVIFMLGRWGMREIGLRSPDGHRFMLGQPIRPS
jgi:hypothetical protein